MQQREFDTLLPPRQLICRSAREDELQAAAAFAANALRSLRLGDPHRFTRLLRFDPDFLQLFYRGEKLVGLTAMLFLNPQGVKALLDEQLDLVDPPTAALAPPLERPAAVYAWLVACPGPAVAGLGAVAKRLSEPRYCRANLFVRAVTVEGLRLLEHLSFKPIPGHPGSLYRYIRICNRNQNTVPRVEA